MINLFEGNVNACLDGDMTKFMSARDRFSLENSIKASFNQIQMVTDLSPDLVQIVKGNLDEIVLDNVLSVVEDIWPNKGPSLFDESPFDDRPLLIEDVKNAHPEIASTPAYSII